MSKVADTAGGNSSSNGSRNSAKVQPAGDQGARSSIDKMPGGMSGPQRLKSKRRSLWTRLGWVELEESNR